ncbi:hypothetical protein [Methylomonas methanica]|uniref:Uncharacterized protein n=1 Tax=Methylomonas methanica (strain DSM 25384 / MC09) TaxID=857087 RepID=G0A3T6_METMM|nr:hypothetical protein [Methylomonas methanica]AEG02708.1 hypothetical protein Metme_4360 [Methylomonas methanica MC09]
MKNPTTSEKIDSAKDEIQTILSSISSISSDLETLLHPRKSADDELALKAFQTVFNKANAEFQTCAERMANLSNTLG